MNVEREQFHSFFVAAAPLIVLLSASSCGIQSGSSTPVIPNSNTGQTQNEGTLSGISSGTGTSTGTGTGSGTGTGTGIGSTSTGTGTGTGTAGTGSGTGTGGSGTGSGTGSTSTGSSNSGDIPGGNSLANCNNYPSQDELSNSTTSTPIGQLATSNGVLSILPQNPSSVFELWYEVGQCNPTPTHTAPITAGNSLAYCSSYPTTSSFPTSRPAVGQLAIENSSVYIWLTLGPIPDFFLVGFCAPPMATNSGTSYCPTAWSPTTNYKDGNDDIVNFGGQMYGYTGSPVNWVNLTSQVPSLYTPPANCPAYTGSGTCPDGAKFDSSSTGPCNAMPTSGNSFCPPLWNSSVNYTVLAAQVSYNNSIYQNNEGPWTQLGSLPSNCPVDTSNLRIASVAANVSVSKPVGVALGSGLDVVKRAAEFLAMCPLDQRNAFSCDTHVINEENKKVSGAHP